MTVQEFRATLSHDAPPEAAGAPLQALWWDAKGDWARAHGCAQSDGSPEAAAVHAYLHRAEGDLANARYWYNRAGVPPVEGALAEEWAALAARFL